MKPALKAFLFFALGAGGASAIFLFGVLPPYNKALDDDLKSIATCQNQVAQWKDAADNGTRGVAQEALMIKQLREQHPPGDQVAMLQTAQSATIIYQRAPGEVDVNLSVGLHGVSLGRLPTVKLGNTQLVPRWIIPGKVSPQTIGEFGGEQYYFFENGQFTGPFKIFPISR